MMTDQQPLPLEIKNESSPQAPLDAPVAVPPQEPSLEQQSESLREASADAGSLAQSVAKVELAFPAIGFINPVEELEKCRQIASTMLESDKKAYPEMVRAKLIAFHADQSKNPPVTDEELALAIYIRRTTDSPLTEADVEAKSTGKVKKDPAAPKAKKQTKAAKNAEDIFKELGL